MSKYKWENMNSAPKDKTIFIAHFWYDLEKRCEDVCLSFFGASYCWGDNDKIVLKNVWINCDWFDEEQENYFGEIDNPVCWCDIPKYPTEDEINNLKLECNND